MTALLTKPSWHVSAFFCGHVCGVWSELLSWDPDCQNSNLPDVRFGALSTLPEAVERLDLTAQSISEFCLCAACNFPRWRSHDRPCRLPGLSSSELR